MAEQMLKKTLGFWGILALAIGSIMGTGLFFGASIGAKYAGNATIFSWVILAAISLYVSACFGELTSMFPKTGGVYEFSKRAYGRFPSFIIGWIAWLVGNIANVVIVIAAVNYLFDLHFLSGYFPLWVKIAVSIILILILNLIILLGTEFGAAVLMLFVGITVSVALAIIAKGWVMVDIGNFSPFFSEGSLFLALPGIFIAIFFLAETFFGWEGATYLAEETKNPEKNVPMAMIIGTLVVAILGILITFVLLGAFPWQTLAGMDTPINNLIYASFGISVGDVIGIGIFITLIGSAAAGFFAMPRLVFALARDRLILSQFTKIHPKFNTPVNSIIFQTIISIIFVVIGFGSYKIILSLFVPLAAIMYIFVLISVGVLRFTKPGMERKFRVPFGKIGPLLTALFFIAIIALWAFKEPGALDLLKLSGSFVLFAFPLYFLVELYYDPKMITDVNDVLAYFTLVTERIALPKSVRREILKLLADIKGKTVLEFGCSVGTLTVPLLEKVGPDGIVYATDFSKNDLRITKKRVDLKNWESEERIYGQIKIIHDLEHMNRVHPDITYADAAVSVGVLGYIQDVKKVLKEVRDILPSEGKICFVEYGDFFHIIPNVEWLSRNEIIEKVFRDCGFSVQVIRKSGLFWNYIFIYGMKYREDVPYI